MEENKTKRGPKLIKGAGDYVICNRLAARLRAGGNYDAGMSPLRGTHAPTLAEIPLL